MKKELQMRLAVAKFLQDTLEDMASKKRQSGTSDNSDAHEVTYVQYTTVQYLASHNAAV